MVELNHPSPQIPHPQQATMTLKYNEKAASAAPLEVTRITPSAQSETQQAKSNPYRKPQTIIFPKRKNIYKGPSTLKPKHLACTKESSKPSNGGSQQTK